MKKYPYIRETGNIPEGKTGRIGLKGSLCLLCKEPATKYLDIAYSYMVGDDETECYCDKHFNQKEILGN